MEILTILSTALIAVGFIGLIVCYDIIEAGTNRATLLDRLVLTFFGITFAGMLLPLVFLAIYSF